MTTLLDSNKTLDLAIITCSSHIFDKQVIFSFNRVQTLEKGLTFHVKKLYITNRVYCIISLKTISEELAIKQAILNAAAVVLVLESALRFVGFMFLGLGIKQITVA